MRNTPEKARDCAKVAQATVSHTKNPLLVVFYVKKIVKGLFFT
jgi:hypothetical protein